jgi:hypothetical protein
MPSQTEVLAWLLEHHPEIHATCEVDRDWVWITANLRELPAVRESIKPYGFRFCAKGHALPCGKVGTWAHHCEKPIGFKRGKKQSRESVSNLIQRGRAIVSESLTPEEMAMLS